MQREIHINAATVMDLANYLGELKQTAERLASSIQAVHRGYLSPDEDEQIQAVLVSYLKTRSALYELVNDCRDYPQRELEERNAAFLIGFAGALLLIDAARFLREQAEDRPIVRRKLNQPVPTFGIPGGSYDMVQQSLFRARHAWHLYHALKYFAQYEAALREFADTHDLQPLMQTIDRLRARTNVSLDQFARARLRTRSDQALRRVGRTLFQRSIYGMQRYVSSAMADVYVRRGHQPRLPSSVIDQLIGIVQPGDVFVVRKEYAVTNYFLPGYWPHAALYLGTAIELQQLGIQNHVGPRWSQLAAPGGDRRVLEAMKDGVRIRSWTSPLACDSLVVLRPRLGPQELGQAITRALSHEGKSYDFDFDFSRADRLVCTEVIYRAFDGLGSMSFPLCRRVGRLTFGGADLMALACSGQAFDPIALYAPTADKLCLAADQDLIAAIGQDTNRALT